MNKESFLSSFEYFISRVCYKGRRDLMNRVDIRTLRDFVEGLYKYKSLEGSEETLDILMRFLYLNRYSFWLNILVFPGDHRPILVMRGFMEDSQRTFILKLNLVSLRGETYLIEFGNNLGRFGINSYFLLELVLYNQRYE